MDDLQITNNILNSVHAVQIETQNEKTKVNSPNKKENVQQAKPTKKEDIEKMVTTFNTMVNTIGTKLAFVSDPRSKTPVIVVTDQDSGKLIRKIPSDEFLSLVSKLENLEGLLFNRKA